MFTLKSNNLKDFPFQDAKLLLADELVEFAFHTGLVNFNSWMLPQIVAHYGNFKLIKDSDGLYDPLALLKDNVAPSDWEIGLWKVITRLPRSKLVKAQVAAAYAKYGSLTPIILYGIRQSKGVQYSQWSRVGLEQVLGTALYSAATAEVPNISRDRLLELRTQGLTTTTGEKAGQLKKATSTWTLTGLKGTELHEMPKLTNTMLAQIWIAHPSLRDPAMILSPDDWDTMPEPLINTEVLIEDNPKPKPHPKAKKVIAEEDDLPWLKS